MHGLFPLLRKSRIPRLAVAGWLIFIAWAPFQFCLAAYGAQTRMPVAPMEMPCGLTGVLHNMHMSPGCLSGGSALHFQCHRGHIASGASAPQPPLASAIALPVPAWSHATLSCNRVSLPWPTGSPPTRISSLSTVLRYSRLLI
ncbi:MAG: hypothetical protein ACYCQK_08155 [Acidiferrobacteraceae bacterium]